MFPLTHDLLISQNEILLLHLLTEKYNRFKTYL